MIEEFDLKTAADVQDMLKEIFAPAIQGMLEAEMDNLLGYDKYERTEGDTKPDSRNGHSQKTVTTSYGDVGIGIPRDQNGEFESSWGKKYPACIRSWKDNWGELTSFYSYPVELRKLIYTTNAIEGFNRQLRKVTKNRAVFPTDDSLFKLLFLAMKDITAKWIGKPYKWALIINQLMLIYPERLRLEDLV